MPTLEERQQKLQQGLPKTLEQRQAALRGAPPIPNPVVPQENLSTGRKIGQRAASVAEGASLGFADELDALLRQQGVLDPNSRSLKDVLESTPEGTRLLGNMIGGGAVSLATAGAAPGLVSTIPRAVGFAATEGALAGLGFAEGGAEERLTGAGQGALIGGTLGFVVPGVTKLTSTLIARASQGLPKGVRFAVDKALRELRRGSITPEQAAKRVEKLGAKGVLADVEELRDLARNVQAVPGPGRRIGKKVLGNRGADARDRIRDAIRQVSSAEDFGVFKFKLIADREAAAKKLFDEARAFGVLEETPAIKSILGTVQTVGRQNVPKRVGGSAITRRLIAKVKANNPELAQLDDLDMRVLDAVYKDLPFQEGSKGFQTNEIRRQLSDAISEQVPVFGVANDTFAGSKAIEEALEQGRKVLSDDDFITARILSEMTEGERDAYLVGVTRAMSDDILKGTKGSNVAARLFSAKNVPKLKAALGGTGGQFRQFKKTMLQEIEFKTTEGAVLGNSVTQRLSEGVADLPREAGRIARATEQFRQGEPVRGVAALLQGRGSKPPLTEDQSRALGQLLFRSQSLPSGNTARPALLQQLLLQSSQQQGAQQAAGLAGAGVSGAAVPGILRAGEPGDRRRRAR